MSMLPVPIWIESVTGERWSETIRLFETVADLKRKVSRKKNIPQSRIAIVFCGRSLIDHMELSDAGIRANSTIKLIVLTKTGPTLTHSEEVQALSDDPSDWERNRQRGCSAPEDTSAKESSAGEAEEGDEESGRRLQKLAEYNSTGRHRRNRTNSQSAPVKYTELAPGPSNSKVDNQSDELSADDVLEDLEDKPTTPVQSSEHDELSEATSEVSSGMIVCDLTNEFRKMKVRRHRAPTFTAGVYRQRPRSKPRNEAHEVSSSEDTDANPEVSTCVLPMASARRNMSARIVRNLGNRFSGGRCGVCSFRIVNPFYCRCGKTVCSRHRSAQSHCCGKARNNTKLQQVSD